VAACLPGGEAVPGAARRTSPIVYMPQLSNLRPRQFGPGGRAKSTRIYELDCRIERLFPVRLT
jgi:hypothetical protein